MAGNTFGQVFKVTTWGESHGKALGVIIDGCPPRLPLDQSDIQQDLDRRRPQGGAPSSTRRREPDQVELLSGTFEGMTTGTPISLLIYNKDVESKTYETIKDIFRPGHGDLTYQRKYGIRDYRGGGRASGRETAARVAAGAVARKVLEQANIQVRAYTLELAGVRVERVDLEAINKNPFLAPDLDAASRMQERIKEIKKSGNSAGGIVEVLAQGCPAGLGEPVFDKLDADLAKAVMSIGAVKAVEIGVGLAAARLLGSECNDEITPQGFVTNRAGGILAGISNGDDIILRAAIKPIPSIEIEQNTVDINMKPTTISVKGRHDVSAIPRIVPVCEAMVCLVLVDHLLRQRTLK
ncbi:MAG: chorismate synthase [Deltaproteobacteria bacterium]|mgnify:CR=1 FL=1|nr:chorismate synthase [Deltaproteobacteria bacterium]MBW2074199.1 chorismate synthase [Deltaproteobacteria bacterium]RLB84006.1 MAG: chorismate synthase [Deltaproteobacteria bacterium]